MSEALEEASTSLDLDNVRPFLRRLGERWGSRDSQWIEGMTERIEALSLGEELRAQIVVQGASFELRAFASDIEVVDLVFVAPMNLCMEIEAEMDAFFEERSM